jgi:surfactin synthase thioesterase subunit
MNISSWLCNKPDDDNISLRVFCIPHAGGGASAFRAWGINQPPGVDICAIHLPGREDRIREPLPDDICVLAQTMAKELLPWLGVPYVLVGNSAGALVSFQLARYLEQWYQLPPVRLVVASARAPGSGLGFPSVSELTDAELVAAIQDRYGGIPSEIAADPGHLAAFLPVLRGDLAMAQAYRPPPGPPLSCPLTAVAGTTDPALSRPDLTGWASWTGGTVDYLELPGGHFSVLSHRDDVLSPVYAEADLAQPAGRPSAG